MPSCGWNIIVHTSAIATGVAIIGRMKKPRIEIWRKHHRRQRAERQQRQRDRQHRRRAVPH
jgi:hypothetical protein